MVSAVTAVAVRVQAALTVQSVGLVLHAEVATARTATMAVADISSYLNKEKKNG